VLGWPVQGIFQGVDGTDINSCCRSNSEKVIATADDFGQVNLFKYPCYVEKAQCKSYMAHSSHVTKVKFFFDDSMVVSTGGGDKTIFVWETDFGAGNLSIFIIQLAEKTRKSWPTAKARRTATLTSTRRALAKDHRTPKAKIPTPDTKQKRTKTPETPTPSPKTPSPTTISESKTATTARSRAPTGRTSTARTRNARRKTRRISSIRMMRIWAKAELSDFSKRRSRRATNLWLSSRGSAPWPTRRQTDSRWMRAK
jgi:hypothetical protein